MKIGVFITMVLWCIGCQSDSPPALENQLIVPQGLKVDLWAESPLFYNPTAIDVDIRGRLWVTEAVNYRTFKDRSPSVLTHPKGDRVVILEDTDGDGKADHSKVFVQDTDLQSPVGIAVIGNRIIVSSAPHLIVYTDADGDDIPDHKEILLTGFGGYDHDHSLHSVLTGPDGSWYFNTGNAGPHIVTDRDGWTLRSGSVYNGGTPYNTTNTSGLVSDDGRTWVGGLALRMNPDGSRLRVMAHNFRNAYELTLDSYGNMWQNDNDDQVTTCRTTWVMENGNAGYFSADGSRFWQADKRPDQSMFAAHWHQDDPGVMPAGDNTGAGAPTGIAFYESDALGDSYLGMLLSADAGRNEVFGYRPKVKGAGFDLSDRIRFASSVPESTENYRWSSVDRDTTKWFRPSDVVVGTDGAIYISDWYDPIVGGHAMNDTVGYGRIYRISPTDHRMDIPTLDLTTINGQIDAFLNPAVNVRNAGFLALRKQGESVIDEISDIITDDPNPYHRSRAIWLMAQLGAQGKEEVIALISSEEWENRLVAYRALRVVVDTELLLEIAGRLATDPHPAVRREVAISLRDVPLDQCRDIIMALAEGYDGQDRWYLEAFGTAMDDKEAEMYPMLKVRFGSDPLIWSPQMANLAWRLHPRSAAGDFEQRIMSSDLSVDERIKTLTGLAFIPDKSAADAMNRIYRQVDQDKVRERAHYWLEHRSSNDWAGFYKFQKPKDQPPPEIAEWRKKLMASQPGSPKREKAMNILAKDPHGGRMLIDLAASNWLSVEEKDQISAWIFSNPDPAVRILAGEFFTAPESIATYSIPAILSLEGDSNEGKIKFEQTCATCHRHDGQGKDIGPDLTGIGSKMDRKTLLDAIVYPAADVVFGYEPWKITLKNGRSYIGFIQGEGAQLILKDATGETINLDNDDIVEREKIPTLMPVPRMIGLTEQDVADVAEYLLEGKK